MKKAFEVESGDVVWTTPDFKRVTHVKAVKSYATGDIAWYRLKYHDGSSVAGLPYNYTFKTIEDAVYEKG